MRLRQSRHWPQLSSFRMLEPGEIDHQIDVDHLASAPAPVCDPMTRLACDRLYHRYVECGAGQFVPDSAFCNVSRSTFLEYLVRSRDIVLTGSNRPDLDHPEPVVLAMNVRGSDTPRYHAFASSVEAIWRAVLDAQRLRELDCSIVTTLAFRGRFYFGIDYRASEFAPFRRGCIYLFAQDRFRRCAGSIRPLARVQVDPWDFPLLDSIHGFDPLAKWRRQQDGYRGYPWVQDADAHPNRWMRPLALRVVARIEAQFDQPLRLRDLGAELGLSPFAVLRLFRAQRGLSPGEYQTLLRIEQARRLLRAGRSIASTAAAVGYCDQAHLTRRFRRIAGITPGQYLRAQESPILD